MVTAKPTEAKKRKPPTFQHLPANRAKKLKRTWVEVQKIKSKWKAQKRKEGLVTRAPTLPVPLEKGESGDEQAEDGEEWGGMSRNKSEDVSVDSEEAESDAGSGEEDSENAEESAEDVDMDETMPSRSKRQGNKDSTSRGRGARGRGRGRGRGQGQRMSKQDLNKSSLREMNNLAYSRSSLHTYKSRGRGDHGGRGRGGTRGRGQPDMRLRMNVMLEKIKRDLV